jgi:hypothetical protein
VDPIEDTDAVRAQRRAFVRNHRKWLRAAGFTEVESRDEMSC